MTTITTSNTLGIDLNPAFYTSPVVIGAGVTISNSNQYVVYRHTGATTFFTIQNDGTITGPRMFIAIGVYLAPGGSVTNAASGYIRGVKISDGAGTVVNDGNITETYTFTAGVDLHSGGSVTNGASEIGRAHV